MDKEHIQKELAAKRKPDSVVKRLGGFKGMAAALVGRGFPAEVRSLFEDGFGTNGKARFSALHQNREALSQSIAKLHEPEWASLVETLLPQVAPSVMSARKTLVHRPYQQGGTRKPFRAPSDPEMLAYVRARWLVHITFMIAEYDADIRWVAEWSAHLAGWFGAPDLGWLLAGAIDVGDDTGNEVYRILEASALGEHENGQMGRHVIQAFMGSSRPEAWAFVERLLLAAQRQEGLRQTILETIDESHPEAFRQMLRLIRDENLSRFSSVVRAADTWFGLLWDGSSAVKIDGILERAILFLDNADERKAALGEADAETVYLALWSMGFDDVTTAIEPARALLTSPSAEIRFVATHFLAQTTLTTAFPHVVDMLTDADLRVAGRALSAFPGDFTSRVDGARLFSQLEQLIARVPKRSKALASIVWPWTAQSLEKPRIAAALAANGSAVEGERLLPYVPDLDPHDRAAFIHRAAGLPSRWTGSEAPKPRTLTRSERTVALDLLGDASGDVRTAAFAAMRAAPLIPDEVDRLVDLLGRKPGDLRSHCIARLATLPDENLLITADRLLTDDDPGRRVAGLELLRDALEHDRSVVHVRARVERHVAEHTELTDVERSHVIAILGARQEIATTDDALGLIDRSKLRTWPEPRPRRVEVETAGARASVEALATLILEHSQTEIRTPSGETVLLVESYLQGPRKRNPAETAVDAPLAEVWQGWAKSRPSELSDPDGLELVRAVLTDRDSTIWQSPPAKQLIGIGHWSSGERFLRAILEWCIAWNPPAGAVTFLLDGLENAVAEVTEQDYKDIAKSVTEGTPLNFGLGGVTVPTFQKKVLAASRWMNRITLWRDLFPSHFQPADDERFYGLLRGFEHRGRGYPILRPGIREFLAVYKARGVDTSELIDLLVGPWSAQRANSRLRLVSTRKPAREFADTPELLDVVDRCRRRIVDIETKRGDRPTAASQLAMELRWTGGLDTVSSAVSALGNSHFARTFHWSGAADSRQDTLSHLILRSMPREGDTLEAFAEWARSAKVRESRLVELAVYAPQWAAHVNHVLNWPGLMSGVWWIEAHTKDDRSWRLQELKESWAAEVSERTPLSAADLTEGAVDVDWFRRAYGELGTERWAALDKAAKYAASSAGHTRAQLFARAMTGRETRESLVKRVDASRHQDSVRALGLLPLAEGDAGAADLLARYTRLQEFRREARKFGSARQASEKRAVAIGLENLARTAGFRDPQRLQWAMEQQAVADLTHGPLVLVRGDTRFELWIDGDGVPSLAMTKNDQTLKTLPASLKKDADVLELKDRLQELKRQRSRVRDALEEAMCRGDAFSSTELRGLMAHPILAPALSRVVFIGDGVAGYLNEGGRALRDHGGAMHALGNDETLRIAHPNDLFSLGTWSAWQRECFRAERVQPFKQLFRELYPITDAEREMDRTRRYAGHQVQPRQAVALLGGRGWVIRPEEGVSRTFHESGLTARLGFEEAFLTPAEIEGLTLDDVLFTKKGEWTPLALRDIPPRVFSEAMRDLDLVVSVAHQGGVDPEATASTVEMRGTLVTETCTLLGLSNVEVKTNHAIVRGELGTYSIHLGSAGVSLMPGTAIPIVAVHSQHRGRLFLPFADDDPRSAEVLSKVLLFARDREIRDPNILKWINAAARGEFV